MMISNAKIAFDAASGIADCIGVFDSGVGGLSVLRALHQRLQMAPKIYVGDVSYAPYGERSPQEVLARCEQWVELLVSRGARLIVIACNTATAAAIEPLRERWPDLRFVGVEPGVKPALAQSRSRRIAVMATSATISSARLRQLVERHAGDAHVYLQACPGLAATIERGVLHGPELLAVLAPFCDRIQAENVDTVALGCTHYPFVIDALRERFGPHVALIDTATAVAEQVARLWDGIAADLAPSGSVRVFSSGASQTMRRLLAQCPGLENTPVESLVPGTGIEPVRPLSRSGGF
jgi:glutamate racemase